jgi:Family of unknown function (DUF5681)
MPFKPGQSGNPKGRPTGAIAKALIVTRDDLLAYIQQRGPAANPFRRLVDRMMSTDNEAIEVACAQALADRLLPKLKAMEVRGSEEHPLRLLVERLDSQPLPEVMAALYPDGAPLRLPHETA